jgi:hypothetical protein
MSRGNRIRRVEPSTSNSDGIWELNEISDYISENKWPKPPLSPINPVVLGNTYIGVLRNDEDSIRWERITISNAYSSILLLDNVSWDLPANWQRVIIGNSYISTIYSDPI